MMGALLRQLDRHTGWVRIVAFSADGCHLASNSWNDTVRVAYSDGSVHSTIQARRPRDVSCHVWDFAKRNYVIKKRLQHNP